MLALRRQPISERDRTGKWAEKRISQPTALTAVGRRGPIPGVFVGSCGRFRLKSVVGSPPLLTASVALHRSRFGPEMGGGGSVFRV